MREAEAALDGDFNETWHGPAIVGFTHVFADRDMERRFLSSMLPSNRRRLLFLVWVCAALTVFGLLASWLHQVADAPANAALAPRLIQLGLCAAGALIVPRAKSPRAVEAMALLFGLVFGVTRCVMIARMPGEASAAMMIGGLAFLYFGLPLRLSLLAPLMAAISGAMVATWLQLGPSASATLSVVEWVWVINLLGLVAVLSMRLILRRQWSQAQALRHLATHDGLTGIANRQFYDQALRREWANCLRVGAPVSLILADVDHFKMLNDCIGHAAGDSCLRDLASVLENCALRPSDIVARTGGEEFALLLPDTQEEGARALAQRIATAIEHAAMAHPASPVGKYVTVSMGVATARPRDGFSAWELTALADRLVYRAKQDGRNRIRQQSLGEAVEMAVDYDAGAAAMERTEATAPV